MINQIPLSLIFWGLAILIIIKLNRFKKAKNNAKRQS
jgi:hypothetical protein